MTRLIHSSALRLSILYVLLFSITISSVLVLVYVWTLGVMDRSTDAVIDSEIQGLAEQYEESGLGGLAATIDSRSGDWGRSGAVYLLTDPALSPITGNLSTWPLRPENAGRWVEFTVAAQERGETVRQPVHAALFVLSSGHRLLVGTNVSQQLEFKRRFRAAIIWAIILVTALGGAIAFWHTRRTARQVSELTESCQQIIAGDLERRLPLSGSGDELDQLAVQVNSMLMRIAELTATLRTTLDSTAHDIRAPLNRIRLRAEQLRSAPADPATNKAALEALITDCERLDRMLSGLLQIAELESQNRGSARTELDLTALVNELVELYEPLASDRKLTLNSSVEAGAPITGHRQLLAQALSNLLDNAVKYTPAGGTIRVTLSQEEGACRLVVADSGPGIPAEDRERVLRPFIQLGRDRDHEGSGLGLSLVAAVARLHDAHLELGDNSPGLTVSLVFPRRASASTTAWRYQV